MELSMTQWLKQSLVAVLTMEPEDVTLHLDKLEC